MSKHRGLDSSAGDSSSGNGNEGMKNASLEANVTLKKDVPNLPEPPEDGKFLHLVPYIYDYCEAVAKSRPPSEAGKPIKVPLPEGRKYVVKPNKVVNNGHSMVKEISLGKCGVLQCTFETKDDKKVINFDASHIKMKSLVRTYMPTSGKPFYLERSKSGNHTTMVFDNPAPKELRDWLQVDKRDVIRHDLPEDDRPVIGKK